MAGSSPFLFSNGVVSNSPSTPSVSTFLESNPGAYTTTRTHNNASCLLFWESHLKRLSNSARILFNANPQLFFRFYKPTSHSLQSPPPPIWNSAVKALVNDSMRKVLPVALTERRNGEEFAITALVSGNSEKLSEIENLSGENMAQVLDVSVHIGTYVPPVFGVRGNGASLAVVGYGRDFAEAKYSDWAKEASGEFKENNDVKEEYFHGDKDTCPFEVQTAPIRAGVLPGIIRQLVIDVCLSMGIPVREVAPSWSRQEFWQEAFITNSLRIMQHVEKIQVPRSWESIEQETLKEISWEVKSFGEDPGMITAAIQKEIMEKAGLQGYPMLALHDK